VEADKVISSAAKQEKGIERKMVKDFAIRQQQGPMLRFLEYFRRKK
jgi:hypothetical protein